MLSERSTFSIIGERYLDTWFEQSEIDCFEAELRARGVVGAKRWFYEYLAASSLWWNFLWWEWVGLDERDIKAGWKANLCVFGASAVTASILAGVLGALLTLLAMHAITLWIGLSLRSGTRPQSPE